RSLWEQPELKAQREPLRVLAAKADVASWPAQTLDLLATSLSRSGDVDTAVALLRRAVGRHAGDVWINYNLARALALAPPPRRDEAIRYYTAARALRPETAHALAHAFQARGDADQAVVILQDLNRLRPENGLHLGCLAQALQSLGQTDEARAALDAAVTALR